MPSIQPRTSLLSICIALFTLAGVLASPHHGPRKRVPPAPPAPVIPLFPHLPPTFRSYSNNPDFPDPKVAYDRLHQAWLDMWHLAAVACVTLDEQEELYQRYFEGGESRMVRLIFCNIAGIEDYNTCDLSTQGPLVDVHMQDLTIIAGQAQTNEVPSVEQPDLEGGDLEIFCTTFQDLGEKGEKAYMQFYKRSFDYPTIDDILTKRTCNGLGRYDSGLMTSLGAHMLHEMVHWRDLVRAANNAERFDAVIPHTIWLPDPDHEDEEEEDEQDYINDYNKYEYENPPVSPTTGYGPTNAHTLVVNGNRASFQNADNYRWYAVSKYWSWKCTQVNDGNKVVFEPQTDLNFDDNMIPEGCNGQVPCP